MSNASLCKCGHIKTDHKQIKEITERLGPCDWLECDCKGFVFERKINTLITNEYRAYIENLEPLIENPGDKLFLAESNKPEPYTIAMCDKRGFARTLRKGYHKKRFNNGEYT